MEFGMLMGCGIDGCAQITNLQAVNGGAKYTSTMTDGSGATIDGIVSSQVCNRTTRRVMALCFHGPFDVSMQHFTPVEQCSSPVSQKILRVRACKPCC